MNDSDGFTLRQFLGILRRRGWIVVQAVAVLAAVAVVLSLRSTNQYEASSVLLVGASKQPLVEQFASGEELSSSAAARLIRTRDVAARVRKALGSHQSVDNLLSRVTTSADSDGFVIITARGESGAEAAVVANAFAAQFVAHRAETPFEGLRKTVRAIQRQLTTAPTGLERQALLAQLAQLKTLAAVRSADTEIVDPAVVPADPIAPTPIRDGLIGGGLGLLLGLVVILVLEALDPRLKSFEELRRLVPAPQLAGVPAEVFRRPFFFRRRLRREPRVAAAARRFPEAFERLRTSLLVFNGEQEIKTILVTSPHDEREGKTTVASSLAVSLAKMGLKVCAVDADLRNPRLARQFGLDAAEPGLAEVLEGGSSVKNVMQHFAVPGAPSFLHGNGNGSERHGAPDLVVVGPGGPTANPGELIAGKGMDELLEELEREFDVVVIDSAPMLEASDALPLAARASGTVLVVRLFHTPRSSVSQAASAIASARGTILGVVGTAVPPRELREEVYGVWPAAHHASPSRVP
jgi:polysaccharide biosynthesis transport protein